MKKYLECYKLEKAYPTPKGAHIVVKDFNFSMAEGEFVSLIGHSGCGKSTVLSMIAGLTHASSGYMILGEYELVGAGPDRGVVFQAPSLLPWFTAVDNVLLGIEQVHPNIPRAQKVDMAHYYLELVGLGHALHKFPVELSNGMCQRVGIARAFALSPRMLLLDEPFGMLDSLTRLELQDILIALWQQNKTTALMVTHDVDEALYLSDRVVMMTNGPEAKVGQILTVDLPRPRQRAELLENPHYYQLRENLIGFLEDQGHSSKVQAA